MEDYWDKMEAVGICQLLEPLAVENGYHVSLAGGCLHKVGKRPDLDVLIYANTTMVQNRQGMLDALVTFGVSGEMVGTWYYRGSFNGKKIEFMFMSKEVYE